MKSFRERRAWVVGLSSIIIITIGVSLAFSINKFQFIKGVYTIYADLEDAAGLQPGNEVRVAGVKVGQVTDVALTDDSARVRMEIENDIALPSETRLEVKLKTLLGQKFIDLQMPEAFLQAGSSGGSLEGVTEGFLENGDVIPIDQTRIPFEIYQAATEGTDVLAEIDKQALRRMLNVFAGSVGSSKQELRRAIPAIAAAAEVLDEQGPDISRVLRNAEQVTGTLAESEQDLDTILARSAEIFDTLAERRGTITSLLAATSDLTANLTVLLQVSRASVDAGAADLNAILLSLGSEIDTIGRAIEELAPAQELFGRPLGFGRFIEGHVCAITTEDTCIPYGSPEDPGVPVKGTQPSPAPRYVP